MDKQLPIKAAEGSRKILRLIIGLVLLCVGFLIGYTVGSSPTSSSYEKGQAAGWEAARVAIAESDLIPALETTVLTGTITAITPEKLEVEVLQVISNPLEQPAPTKRVVSLGADTKLFWATLFTEQESVAAEESYNKAHEAWQKQIDAGLEMDPPEPPGENKLEKIELSRLITGMTVKIIASENIATATSFEAIRIEASESMTPEEETEPELEGTVIEDNANYDATIVDSDEALPLDSEPEGINPNTDDQPTTPAVEPGGGTAPELDAEE